MDDYAIEQRFGSLSAPSRLGTFRALVDGCRTGLINPWAMYGDPPKLLRDLEYAIAQFEAEVTHAAAAHLSGVTARAGRGRPRGLDPLRVKASRQRVAAGGFHA